MSGPEALHARPPEMAQESKPKVHRQPPWWVLCLSARCRLGTAWGGFQLWRRLGPHLGKNSVQPI